jgi:GT2 family glycosyltransferase
VAAANDGIAAARHAFIQLLNDDAEVTPNWAEAAVAAFDDPRVGSVAPLVRLKHDPGLVDSAGDGYDPIGWGYKRGHGEPASNWIARGNEPVFGASGAAAIYRAEAIRRVGGFEPLYGAYYEDLDLAFRLRWGGYTCVFVPSSQVLHYVSASYNHANHALQRRISRNRELLFWSNLPTPWLIACAGPHLASTIVRMIQKAGQGQLRPFLAGQMDAIRQARWIVAGRRIRLDLARRSATRPRFAFAPAPYAARLLARARRGAK